MPLPQRRPKKQRRNVRPLQLVKKAAKLLLQEALPGERASVLCGIAGLFAKGSAVFGAISPIMTVFYGVPAAATTGTLYAFLLGRFLIS